ncbi:MAG: PD-(D/E)XK nuclease family protein [Phormidium sp.]
MTAKNFSQPQTSPLSTPDPEPILRLSQSHLNRLQDCPRWFQISLIEHRDAPVSPPQQQRLAEGNRFHQLMQQRELGLPIESVLPPGDKLRRWIEDFDRYAPTCITPNPNRDSIRLRDAEHERSLFWQNILWLVRYDLLLLSPKRAQILDWKTYRRPRQPTWLKQNWQTRLYPFVLAETSSYPPESISLIYWFVEGATAESDSQSGPDSTQPTQCWQFNYSSQEHEATRRDLSQIAQQFQQYWLAYQQGQDFPRRQGGSGPCDRRSCFCHKLESPGKLAGDRPLTDLQEIPEVSL